MSKWLPILMLACFIALPAHAANMVEEATLSVDNGSFDESYGSEDNLPYVSDFQLDNSLNLQESLWDRVRDGFSMPDIDSSYTYKHEQWYASRPDYVSRMLDRSKKYLFHIVEEVEKRGMPTEIALLPMIESGFNPTALSTSKASGIWQFIPSTGKDFGLKQNYWKDSRKDVTAATQAALNYLQRLYTMFGAWDLALAAYNAGEGTVARAIERNRKLGLPTDYQHLSLPDETKNYVPKLQAIKNIIFKPEQFGLKLNDIPNSPYFTTVEAPNKMDVTLAAELAGISVDEFNALNPSFKRPILIAENSRQKLLLPTWAAARFNNNLRNYDQPLSKWHSYQPKRGERLGNIANQFGISIYELSASNNIKPNKNLIVRKPILVPAFRQPSLSQPIDVAAMTEISSEPTVEREQVSHSTVTHRVKRGETLASLAKRYQVTTKQIMQTNHLKSKQLSSGQTIQILQQISSHQSARRSHVKNQHARSGKHASHATKSAPKASRNKAHKVAAHPSKHRKHALH